jgi:NAD(P)-dependent dehydrogenase (short-subunit alcohol dehydrogenase family)
MTRVAVVTGVLGDIGASIADRFAGSGWTVLGMDKRATAPSSCSRFLSFDLANYTDLPAALDELVGEDQVDTLVNNAGVQYVAPIASMAVDALVEVFSVNTFAPYVAIQTLAARLEATHGSVVNISSVHANATSRGMSAYAASKAALVGLTRAAAVDLAPAGIRVNAVLPGAVDTAMLRQGMAERAGGVEGSLARLAAGTPLGRIGRPNEVADLVEYLADTRRSSFVTGQSFVLDGGALARLGTE